MPRITIKQLEAELTRVKQSKEYYAQIVDRLKNIFTEDGQHFLSDQQVTDKVQALKSWVKEKEGAEGVAIYCLRQENSRLWELVQVLCKDERLVMREKQMLENGYNKPSAMPINKA